MTADQEKGHVAVEEQKASSSAPDTPTSSTKLDFNDAAVLMARQVEKTNNKTGFMFLRIHEAALEPWLTSLPRSEKPLADLGACYGVNTLHALKRGRDVVAVDADALHISTLRQRASRLQTRATLRGAIVATLPCAGLFEQGSLAGALVSEMLPFLPLGGPLKLFEHIFGWLERGGVLVTTSISPSLLNNERGRALKYHGGISFDEAMRLFDEAPHNIAELAPGFVQLSAELKSLDVLPDTLYVMSREEVRRFAEMAGFEVLSCEYCETTKYMMEAATDNESVVLIARKGGG